nr:DUF4397 domain-containing protein [Gemmatimonadaceae bacterium]
PEVALRAQRFDRGIVYGHIRDADVFVVHGINGRDLDLAESLPVDVEIDGRCAIPNLQFREIRGPLALPAGSYDIRVRLAAATPCSGTAVISVDDATLVAGTNVSIVAHLSATGQPTASIFANDLEGGPSSGTIAARHVAAFGPVDVAVGNERLFTNVRNGQGGLAAVEAGDARVRVFAAGGRRAAFKGRTVFTPEFLNVFYAVGTPSRGTFEVLHQEIFLFGRDAARVALVHGINGRDLNLPEALPVDVEVNGICAEPNFRFRTITASRPLAAGTYTVRVRLADAARPCSGTAVITAEGVRVERGTYVSIAAHLSAAGAPTASVFRDDLVTRQQATLAARHVANFGAVDVLLNGRVAFAGVRNGQGGAAAAPVGRQRVAIAAAGSPTPALEAEPALAGAPFVNVLWAVGTPANGTFEVLAQRVAILF